MSHDEACANCGAPLTGPYCAACGQKAVHLRVTMHDFAHDAVHEFLHFDGKIVRTMKLLVFRPGELTREYVAGRRASYVSPVRMYLIWSALFFFLMIALGREFGFVKVGEGPSPRGGVTVSSPSQLENRFERGARAFAQNPDRLNREISQSLAKAMFLLMPLFALLLLLFYRRREPFYVPHLYFSVHYHAFVFFLLCVATLLIATNIRAIALLGALLQLAMPVYLVIALRRVYGGSRVATLVKTAGILALYLVLLSVTMIGIVMWSLYRA